ncbi:MAG: alpha-mannosidase [Alicyclobacillus sp.]|nr:alpha-mannosidase [Alicyclobacillus sp.]
MYFTEEKLGARVRELATFRYRDVIPLLGLAWQPDDSGANGALPPDTGEWQPVQVGQRWEGVDQYFWLQAVAAVPRAWSGRKVLALLDFGDTGDGYNSGFESMLFLEGKPYQGVDSNHQEVFLPGDCTGAETTLHVRLWSGLGGMDGYHQPQAHQVKRADLCWLDEIVDDLYFTATVALETVHVLSPGQPERAQLLQALDVALRQIDWRQPGSPAFYQSLTAAQTTLHRRLREMDRRHPVSVHLVGHTHIDVAWLWRLRHTREKAARSFATVLRLMELYPDYVFMQSQPQLYEFVKTDYPHLYEQLRKRVREGRWEADGGMWLEADCNLPSGESIVRQILFGTRFLRAEFGVECRYLWLPDVFGYSWALPQILRKSGLDTFMTTKISWNQYNRMPHDTFWWRGMDGSEVLTHFVTTPHPSAAPGSWRYVYEGEVSPKALLGSWEAYRDKEINQELVISYGFGDGGGGVNRDMLERIARVQEIPGLPRVTTGTARAYFERLHERIASTDGYVHTWDGELYLEYHRGTYTSQAFNKRMNRKLELLYREAEWLSAFASVLHGDWTRYPQADLNAGWKILLRNQFHDIIPGSSIHEVYEDSRAEYREAEQMGLAVLQSAVEAVCTAGDLAADGGASPTSASNVPFTVFNAAPWPATGLLEIPKDHVDLEGWWVDEQGRKLTAQEAGQAVLVRVEDVPPLGFATVHLVSTGTVVLDFPKPGGDPEPFTFGPGQVRTPFYELRWDDKGRLTRLFDIENEREVLAAGRLGNELQVFEDKPLRFDAWDIDLFYQQRMWTVDDLVRAEVTEIGPLRAVLRFEWRYSASTIRQDLILYAHDRRIDFRTEVDWAERQQLLKVAFPVSVRATEATYDVQFGNVRRPTHWNTSWDWARFETVGHQWADLSERGYGVSLLNDCKYGYDIHDNVLRLSLIKSAIRPDRTADLGRHVFTYALYPHAGDWFDGETAEAAWALNQPLRAVAGPIGPAAQAGERRVRAALPVHPPTLASAAVSRGGAPVSEASSPPGASLFRISGRGVMVDAVKKAEDGARVLLRLHDFSGGRRRVTVASDWPIASWQEADLMERPLAAATGGPDISFHLGPYEIKTFLVDFAPAPRDDEAAHRTRLP